jgi:membrane protein DedA with SNARE-associated domain
MHTLFTAIVHHGYLALFLALLAESIGLPLPAAVALVAAGAASASGTLSAPVAWGAAMAGLLVGDNLVYLLGRYMGWALLGFLCKVSLNPESCVLRSAELFYKRGQLALLLAKFIPGLNTMAPPLAGSMRMPYPRFLCLEAAGALLYVLVYGGLGYLFHRFLHAIAMTFGVASRFGGYLAGIAVVCYLGYRVYILYKNRVYRVVPRVQAEELARKLASEEAAKVVLVDARSHGYYDAGAARIRGSIRLEPNNLIEEIRNLPKDKDFYVYCT